MENRALLLAVAAAVASSCVSPAPNPPPFGPVGDAGWPDSGTSPGSDASVDDGGAPDASATSDAGAPDAASPCGTCFGGLSCDSSTKTCYLPCPPSCPGGYTCDTTQTPSRCVPQLALCDGGACAVGQNCIDGACRCDRTRWMADGGLLPDTCLAYGYTCERSGTCLVPSELGWCRPLGGCQTPFDCVPMILGGTFVSYRCARGCSTAADCVHPKTTCITAPPVPLAEEKGHCGFARCTNYFGACPAGTCVPTVEPAFDVGPTNYFTSVGVCLRPGTAAAGADCDPGATLADAGWVCGSGEDCRGIAGAGGVCGSICNYGSADGGPGCGSGGKCVNATGIEFFTRPSAQLGVCSAICDLFAPADGGDCPANSSGRTFGCQPERFDDVAGQCTPDAPGAGTENRACTVDLFRDDSPCRSRMFCTGWYTIGDGGIGGGICERYCDRRVCGGDAGCLPTCGAGGLCQPVTVGSVLGRCAGSDAGAAD